MGPCSAVLSTAASALADVTRCCSMAAYPASSPERLVWSARCSQHCTSALRISSCQGDAGSRGQQFARTAWRALTAAESVAGATGAKGSVRMDESIGTRRSEEHTSELQSHSDLVCRLLLEKKKTENKQRAN